MSIISTSESNIVTPDKKQEILIYEFCCEKAAKLFQEHTKLFRQHRNTIFFKLHGELTSDIENLISLSREQAKFLDIGYRAQFKR